MTDYTNARAVYFPDDENWNSDSWQVQAGEYADEPDLVIVVEHGAGRCKHAVAADEHAQRSAGVKVVADASSRTDGQLRLPMFGEMRLKPHAVTEVHAVGDVDSSVAVDLRTLAEVNMAADVRALHAQPSSVQHRL